MADEASAQAGGGGMVPRGDLRASHDDRDRVVELLTGAAGDGRLTPEELDERVGAALTARTHGELAALVSDLPAVPDLPAGAAAATPKDLVRIDCHSGAARRDGRWVVPRRMEVRAPWGPGVPVRFRIDVSGEVAGGSVTARPPAPPRRTLLQWLRRRPRSS
jgi:Domain of unknown function (DUF1707)